MSALGTALSTDGAAGFVSPGGAQGAPGLVPPATGTTGRDRESLASQWGLSLPGRAEREPLAAEAIAAAGAVGPHDGGPLSAGHAPIVAGSLGLPVGGGGGVATPASAREGRSSGDRGPGPLGGGAGGGGKGAKTKVPPAHLHGAASSVDLRGAPPPLTGPLGADRAAARRSAVRARDGNGDDADVDPDGLSPAAVEAAAAALRAAEPASLLAPPQGQGGPSPRTSADRWASGAGDVAGGRPPPAPGSSDSGVGGLPGVASGGAGPPGGARARPPYVDVCGWRFAWDEDALVAQAEEGVPGPDGPGPIAALDALRATLAGGGLSAKGLHGKRAQVGDGDAARSNANHALRGWRPVWVGTLPDAFGPAGLPLRDQEPVTRALLAAFRCVPVFLERDLSDLYYKGFCKGHLWPLLHHVLPSGPAMVEDGRGGGKASGRPDSAGGGGDGLVDEDLDAPPPPNGDFRARVGAGVGAGAGRFSVAGWRAFVKANKAFCDRILEVLSVDTDVVWCHDYHLLVAPSLLRKRFHRIRVGLFLHSPFPSSEVFRTSPRREELVRALLNADVVGFHAFDYARHFLSCCQRMLGLAHRTDRGSLVVDYYGRRVSVRILPAGVRPLRTGALARSTAARARGRELRLVLGSALGAPPDPNRLLLPEGLGSPTSPPMSPPSRGGATAGAASATGPSGSLRTLPAEDAAYVFVGVDDLDSFKGLDLKLQAFGLLLDEHPQAASRAMLVQVVGPPRAGSPGLEGLSRYLDHLAAEINKRHGRPGRPGPVVLWRRTLDGADRAALLARADALAVTATRDGMNLMPYE